MNQEHWELLGTKIDFCVLFGKFMVSFLEELTNSRKFVMIL